MNAKKLLPFAIILAVLGGLVLVKSQRNEPQSIVTQAKLKALVPGDVTEDDVTRIKLFAAGKEDEAVELTRSGEGWTIASTFDAPANAEAVDGFVEKLFDIRGEARAKNVGEDKLGNYSLKDDEAFHVQAFTSGDTPVMDLLVGKAADFKTIFLREAGGDTVYVEAVNLRSEAGIFGEDMTQAPTADKWLDKEVLALEQDAIESVALTMPDKTLRFARTEVPAPETESPEDTEDAAPAPPAQPEYEWNLTEGGGGHAFKQAGLDKILTRLANLQATTVADPEKAAEYGLDNPGFRAEIGVAGGDDVVIEAGRPTLTGNGYIRIAGAEAPQIYEVSKFNLDQIFPKGSELFDLPGIGATADAVSRIEISQPSGTVVLSKAGDAWQVDQPAAGLATQDSKLTAAAAALAAWTPADYADNAVDAGAFDQTASFTVDGTTRSIHAAGDAASTDGVYVKLDDQPAVYVMSRTDAAKIFLAPRDVFQLSVIDFDAAAAQSITATLADKEITLTKTGDSWNAATPDGSHEAATDAVNDLLATLNEYQVSDFATDRSAADWTPELAVSVATMDGTTHGLNFGPMNNGSHPTAVEGKTVIFTTNPGVVARIKGQIQALAAPPAPTEAAPEDPAAEATPAAPSITVTPEAPAMSVETETPVQVTLPVPAADAAE